MVNSINKIFYPKIEKSKSQMKKGTKIEDTWL